jgi:hypothetical protein
MADSGRGAWRGGRGGRQGGRGGRTHEDRPAGDYVRASGGGLRVERGGSWRGGRGRGGGSVRYTPREIIPSYGVLPFVQREEDGAWFFFAQVQLSASLFDFKVDPFRGRAVQDETPWSAAVREGYEESCGVLDLRSARINERDAERVPEQHFVRLGTVKGETIDVAEVMAAFDHNHALLQRQGGHEHKDMLETDALVLIQFKQGERVVPTTGLRYATHVVNILREAQNEDPSTFPLVTVRRTENNGLITYRAVGSGRKRTGNGSDAAAVAALDAALADGDAGAHVTFRGAALRARISLDFLARWQDSREETLFDARRRMLTSSTARRSDRERMLMHLDDLHGRLIRRLLDATDQHYAAQQHQQQQQQQ